MGARDLLNRFRNTFTRAARPSRVRSFDGATGGRRGSGMGSFGPINSEVGAGAEVLARRAKYLVANNPYLNNAVANWVGALVGSGIRPSHANSALVARFDEWSETCDADGRTDSAGLLAILAHELVTAGECFVHLLDDRLRVLPADQVDRSQSRNLAGGAADVQGVRFDANGRRTGYWVFPSRPLDGFESWPTPVLVPAENILHVMRPIAPGQVRGVSWLAPIVLAAAEFDKLADALLMGVQVAAMHAGFLTDLNAVGGLPAYDGNAAGGVLESGLEPGVLKVLPAGVDVKFNTPQAAQQTTEFMKAQLRGLAAGLGLPSHLLDNDLSGANYSSLRAGLLPFRQRVEQVQYGVLVPQFLAPVWRRFVLGEALAGRLDDIATARRCEWIMPRWASVDPLKDVQADVAEIDAGLASRAEKIAARGWTPEEVDAARAADKARETVMGLVAEKPAPQPTVNDPKGAPNA